MTLPTQPRPAPTSGASPLLTQGCMLLFALPFAAGGIIALVQCIRPATQGRLTEAAGPGIAGLLFTTIGVGLIIGSSKARKLAEQKAARVAAAPGQPWLWREDWASRRVEDRNRFASMGLWVFALLWNLIALPVSIAFLSQGIDPEQKAAWLILLFPLIGLGLLAGAIHASMRAHRFGRSVLELVAVPAPIGREIAGRIRVPHAFDATEGVTLTLTCSRVVVRQNGKNTSTTTTILWQDEQQIPGVGRDSGSATIPFVMRIPAEALATDESDSRNKVVWQLGASAVLAGVDYDASFEVPVFHTAESDQAAPAELVAREQQAIAEYQPPANAPFRITERPTAVEVDFPMARNVGVAAGITGFTLIWSGVVAMLFSAHAPVLFRIVFGGFELLLLWMVLWAWFGHATLSADSSGLAVLTGVGPWAGTTRYAPTEIRRIAPKVGMTAGNRAYYDLQLTLTDGSSRSAASGLRDLRSAEWLASRLSAAMGLRAGVDA
ncbi:MAG: hypothetical protein ABJC74_07120 [Gemmatimonadota bacterium]